MSLTAAFVAGVVVVSCQQGTAPTAPPPQSPHDESVGQIIDGEAPIGTLTSAGRGGGAKVGVCHRPPGRVINVPPRALRSHLAHGDTQDYVVNEHGSCAAACDDGDPCTVNDHLDANDNCVGMPAGGMCGASCDDGDACTVNDHLDANDNCVGTFVGCEP